MTYGQIKRRVMEYLNQYSVAGAEISPAYNNQSDYEHRIPGLINSALSDIRGLYPRRRAVQLTGGSKLGTRIYYALPSDYKALCTGGVYAGDDMAPSNDYQLFGDSGVLVPDDGRTYWMEYYQRPEQFIVGTSQADDPEDSSEIPENQDALEAACAYAASWLALNDDAFDHTALQHLYEDKLERMRPPLTAEIRDIESGQSALNFWM